MRRNTSRLAKEANSIGQERGSLFSGSDAETSIRGDAIRGANVSILVSGADSWLTALFITFLA
ncbi:hypothetical protein BCT27_19160 [Enterovibrio norvegicus]|nr:hypothetical protein BCT27_19160 [Enterovibrio norvegicus]